MMPLSYYDQYRNKKYNKLTFIKFSGYGEKDNRGKRRGLGLFKCDCGNKGNYIIRYVINGDKISCGCDKKREKNKNWTGHGEISGDKWRTYIDGAKQREIEFTIKIDDAWDLFLKQGRKCNLSGLDISFYPNCTASLDRIDSGKSYTLDNIQWVHKDVNRMKNAFSETYFLEICQKVINYRTKPRN